MFIELFNPLVVCATYMEEFIKLSTNGNLKLEFTNQPLSKFWINVQNAYTTLAREALKKLLAFAITYLCETGFSHYVLTKIKYAYRTEMQSRIF